MAVLTAKSRASIPTSKFAGPDRSYPVEDKNHAINAKARATQQEHAGNLSPAEDAHIQARANAVLKVKGQLMKGRK